MDSPSLRTLLSAILVAGVLAAMVTIPSSRAAFSDTTATTSSFDASSWTLLLSIDGGGEHTCAVKSDGTVWCWGKNDKGQLGDGTTSDSTTPVQVAGVTAAIDVGTGTSHSCAATTTGSVWCWGLNSDGQLGDGTTGDSLTAVQVTALTFATAVAAGNSHTCAIRSSGGARCWGKNDKGQLGDGTTTDSEIRVAVVSAETYRDEWNAIAFSGDDGTSSWNADWQELGETNGPSSGRVRVSSSGNCTSTNCLRIGAGDASIAGRGVSRSANLAGAGSATLTYDYDRSVDEGDSGGVLVEASSDGLAWTTLATYPFSGGSASGSASHDIGAYISSGTSIRFIGYGSSDGDYRYFDDIEIAVTEPLDDAVAIGLGETHSCVANGDGTVACWGLNNEGQLGDGTTTDRDSAVPVSAMTAAVAVDGGDKHTCAVNSDGTAWCWGKNDKGQLGDGTGSDSVTPVQVVGIGGTGTLTGAAALGVGLTHACAGRDDGSAVCWGLNDKGQLGDGTTGDSDWPVAVVGIGGTGTLADVGLIAGGEKHSCAALAIGAACWGSNSKGQLGDNTTSDSSSPVTVANL